MHSPRQLGTIKRCIYIDYLLENNLQDMKYNMSGIKSALQVKSVFITQTFAENDITELSIVAAHDNI